MKLDVTPIAKPRMTQSDRWRQRRCVVDYRLYCDYLRDSGARLPERVFLAFELPMPRSWSKKKRGRMNGTPHKQRPDLDNLIKSVLDALAGEDSYVYQICAIKCWGDRGALTIQEIRRTHVDTWAELEASGASRSA